jgi:hypothetical protein
MVDADSSGCFDSIDRSLLPDVGTHFLR